MYKSKKRMLGRSLTDLPLELVEEIGLHLDPRDMACLISSNSVLKGVFQKNHACNDDILFISGDGEDITYKTDKELLSNIATDFVYFLDTSDYFFLSKEVKMLHSPTDCSIQIMRWVEFVLGDTGDEDADLEMDTKEFVVLRVKSEDGLSELKMTLDPTSLNKKFVSTKVVSSVEGRSCSRFPVSILALYISLGVLKTLKEYQAESTIGDFDECNIPVPKWLLRYIDTWDRRELSVRKVLYDSVMMMF